jgi:uncharacterized protein YceK
MKKMALVALVVAALIGCSTYISAEGTNVKSYKPEAIVPFGIYSGTRRNIHFHGDEGSIIDKIFATLDFPCSLAFDTFLLPFSIPWQLLLPTPKPRGKGKDRSPFPWAVSR